MNSGIPTVAAETELPLNVQLTTVGLPPLTKIPPPQAATVGAGTSTRVELPRKAQLITVASLS